MEVRGYEKSLKYYRDLQNSMDTARDEGREEGIEIGKEQGIEIGKEQGREEAMREVAIALLQTGMVDAQILAMTGLTMEQLKRLKEG